MQDFHKFSRKPILANRLYFVKGLGYNEIIKIGFLNENIKEQLDIYKEKFDVVIINDGDFNYINKIKFCGRWRIRTTDLPDVNGAL